MATSLLNDLAGNPSPNNPPSRYDIIRLAQENPVLYAVLGYWHQGLCTWEEALSIAVVVLLRANQSLVDKLTDFHSYSVRSNVK